MICVELCCRNLFVIKQRLHIKDRIPSSYKTRRRSSPELMRAVAGFSGCGQSYGSIFLDNIIDFGVLGYILGVVSGGIIKLPSEITTTSINGITELYLNIMLFHLL